METRYVEACVRDITKTYDFYGNEDVENAEMKRQ
jgi:hypothetical protein